MSLKPFLKLFTLAFQLLRQHHVEAFLLDILVSEYKHKSHRCGALSLGKLIMMKCILLLLEPSLWTLKARHILEHTALCGSEKFPVRDPFF